MAKTVIMSLAADWLTTNCPVCGLPSKPQYVIVIFRRSPGDTGQPECHECGTSARETFWTFAENFGGPAGVGEGDGVGVLGAGGEGETDASVWKAAGAGVTAWVPPQAVRPRTATVTIADLGFHVDDIRAEYLCGASRRRLSGVLGAGPARSREGFAGAFLAKTSRTCSMARYSSGHRIEHGFGRRLGR
ncbi:hypothetical protein Psi02_09850 [Planotetraspora silvatica]|uniref:Uncharacterized protein n=1 Tax=Planotetraspora silvatica TaxID=234614 RepID=A0A8J3UHG4_9ACTN|nr:hypothetical protein Psi02_09850 [Planotetraspora silvatica]